MKAKKIVAILAIAAMLVLPATAFAASSFSAGPRTVVEGHTTYAVVVEENVQENNEFEEHQFAAVAGYAELRNITRDCERQTSNGVLWFNDQFFIDSVNVNICVEVIVSTTVGAFVCAAETGDDDPQTHFADVGLTAHFTYSYTDPNGVGWSTREFSYPGLVDDEYFWCVAIAATTVDIADNNPARTAAITNCLAPGDHKDGPGATFSDPASTIPCSSPIRSYNFVVLIDQVGSTGCLSSDSVSKMDALASLPHLGTTSDDGQSHLSQVPDVPHLLHDQGSVDLWFNTFAPPAGGCVKPLASTYAYH